MKKEWTFIRNPFLIATDDSYVLAVLISAFHLAALRGASAVTFFDDLAKAYEIIHTTLNDAYDEWKSKGEVQQGDTLDLGDLLKLLRGTKIKKWDIDIQKVYSNETAKYKALLPNNRKPFQRGKQLARINQVRTLAINIGTDADLATLKAETEAFYTLINSAYEDQKKKLSQTSTGSNDVEAARIAMCQAQYGNLGLIMDHFKTNPADAEPFFDLENIRKSQQVLFKRKIAAGTHKLIVEHTFADGDQINIKNTGPVDLSFYLAPNKNSPLQTIHVTVAAGAEVTIEASDLGPLSNAFLCVANNGIAEGKYELDLNA